MNSEEGVKKTAFHFELLNYIESLSLKITLKFLTILVKN